jgi:adhesin/invasin
MKRAANTGGALHGASRWVTWTLTTAAALTALLVNARNLGLTPWFGLIDLSFADRSAYRVQVSPRADSLTAVGDTTVLAATVTDRRGAVLTGALVHWHTEDSTVAVVDSSGTVVARGPGATRVTASVRQRTGGAMITVFQTPARVLIAGDSSLRVRQGDTVQLAAIALDARGHRIGNATPRWRSGDTSVVSVDSLGTAIGRGSGHTRLRVAAGSTSAEVDLEVELTATSVAVVSGANQHALAGRKLGDPIVLQLLARTGQPVPGAAVSLSTLDGEGQVDPQTALADKDGRVRFTWTLGRQPGVQYLMARLASTDSAFSLVAEAEPLPGTVRSELVGDAPDGPAGLTLSRPVTVRFTDTAGTALAGVPVSWTLLDGGAMEGAARTDSLGTASATWTLGPRAGRQRLLAQIGNARVIPAFTIAATAEPRAPAGIRILSGQGQVAQAGKALPKPVILMLTDSVGNGIAGVPIVARTAQGSLAETTVTTNAQGRLALRWKLGPTAGDQTVQVRTAGLDSVAAIEAHAAAGPPAKVAVTAIPPTKGTTGTAVGIVATVTDAMGNPVPNAAVAFVITGGTPTAARTKSDANGKATVSWVPASPGTQKATAAVTGTHITASTPLRGNAGVPRRRADKRPASSHQ